MNDQIAELKAAADEVLSIWDRDSHEYPREAINLNAAEKIARAIDPLIARLADLERLREAVPELIARIKILAASDNPKVHLAPSPRAGVIYEPRVAADYPEVAKALAVLAKLEPATPPKPEVKGVEG